MQVQRTLRALAVALALVSANAGAQSVDQVYEPGNGTTLPVVVTQVKADYTQAAMKARIEGTVVLQSIVPRRRHRQRHPRRRSPSTPSTASTSRPWRR